MFSKLSWLRVSFLCVTLLLQRNGRPSAQDHILPALRDSTQRAFRLFQAGRYEQSRQAYLAIAEKSKHLRNPYTELYARDLAALCAFSAFDFATSMRELLAVSTQAQQHQFYSLFASVQAAIASNYAEMGDLRSARHAADRALAVADLRAPGNSTVDILLVAGSIAGRLQDFKLAHSYFGIALAAASGGSDLPQEAKAWHAWGEELLLERRFGEAEGALARAFLLRRLKRDPRADSTLLAIARAEHGLGLYAQASAHFDRVLENSARATGVPRWLEYYRRGRLRRDAGRVDEALADFRRSFQEAREWRLGVVPADNARMGSEVRLEDLTEAFIEAAFEAARRHAGGSDPTREALDIAEQLRASSLRQAVWESKSDKSAEEIRYAQLLARLRQAESNWLYTGSSTEKSVVLGIKAELDHFDVELGLSLVPEAKLVENSSRESTLLDFQSSLQSTDAVLIYSRAGDRFYRWAITRDSYQSQKLPSSTTELGESLHDFRQLVLRGGSDSTRAGSNVAHKLLSDLPGSVQAKSRWYLVLDDVLFEIPWAAMSRGFAEGRDRYLVEEHTLEILPGMWALVSASQGDSRPGERFWSGEFIGVGDPVYNRADERVRRGWSRLWQRWLRGSGGSLELSRLPGSAAEVRSCAGVWPEEARVLLGPDATRERVRAGVAESPAVLHFATHVVEGPEPDGGPYLALSMGRTGRAEFLGAREIASWRGAMRLVVMSGCGSGNAEVLPGAGMMGLTRAWMLAGAQMVVATHWPTGEDDGVFFEEYYRQIRMRRADGASAGAAALAETQRGMIRSGSWQAQPIFWAAPFLIGRR